MITTIIFDLSEVYLQGIVGSAKYVQQKIDTSVSDYYFYEKEFDQLILGQITEDTYWEAIIKKNVWSTTIGDLKKAVRSNFREIEGTREVFKKLKKNGYQLILLSNHAKEWVAFCEEKYNFHQFFDAIFYSFAFGIAKPNKKIFNIVLNKLCVDPSACLFIDDNKENITMAATLHMKTVLFTTKEDLEKEMKKLKIKIK